MTLFVVMPAQAGIQKGMVHLAQRLLWIPAFAGMTKS